MLPRPASSKKNKEQSSSSSTDSTSSDGVNPGNTSTSAVTMAIGRTMACRRPSCCWLFSSICATWRYSQLL
ncbi:hypothetical protein BLA29_005921 [Euroglyphus maynei]|uniref:Uncharacterized protein n=1 Tax=Euroglyphus maynei TaxID=6958 RepID=A0A1Y3BIM3_EURMA|nr:hypothetical protein BLA29_005921 [Euroglyphus maynei]